VIVTDTGYGAINTLRPKRKRRIPQVGNETGEEVLTAAVTGRAQTMNDPGLIWARTGFEIAIREAGTPMDDDIQHEFTILAGDGLNGDVVWVSVHADGSSETGRHRGIPFVGTTVFASLPIPHGQRKNSEAELESSGGVLTPA
jgi:hypothetical protein